MTSYIGCIWTVVLRYEYVYEPKFEINFKSILTDLYLQIAKLAESLVANIAFVDEFSALLLQLVW